MRKSPHSRDEMAQRCCFSIQNTTAFFFNRDSYMVVGNIIPGAANSRAIIPPTLIADDWPAPGSIPWMPSSTSLPDQRICSKENSSFSSQTSRPARTPTNSHTHQSRLRNLGNTGFTTIDAILPMGGGIAYFFSGYQYARVGGIDEQTTLNLAIEVSIVGLPLQTLSSTPSLGRRSSFNGPQYIYVEGISRADPPARIINGWPGLDGFW